MTSGCVLGSVAACMQIPQRKIGYSVVVSGSIDALQPLRSI